MGFEANRRVETSAKTFAVIEYLQHNGPTRISALATDLEMSKGIVHNHVSTLRELGYVIKVGPRYHLSSKLFSAGWQVRSQSRFFQHSDHAASQLAARLETGVFLFEPAGEHGCVLCVYGPERTAVSIPAVGSLCSLSSCLVGAVIRVACDPAQQRVLGELSAQHPAYDIELIRDDVRETGVSSGPLTAENPVSSVATPVCDAEGWCHGAIGVVVDGHDPAHIREEVVGVRQTVADRFSYDWESERSFATEKHSWLDT